MKPHPRIRKTVKWGGAAATLLLLVVWIGSVWRGLGWWAGDGQAIWLGQGGIFVSVFTSPAHVEHVAGRGWWFISTPPHMQLRPWFQTAGALSRAFLPTWIPIVVFLVPIAAAWRWDAFARRRARLSLCPHCNYDLKGLAADAVCPECGTQPAAKRATHA